MQSPRDAVEVGHPVKSLMYKAGVAQARNTANTVSTKKQVVCIHHRNAGCIKSTDTCVETHRKESWAHKSAPQKVMYVEKPTTAGGYPQGSEQWLAYTACMWRVPLTILLSGNTPCASADVPAFPSCHLPDGECRDVSYLVTPVACICKTMLLPDLVARLILWVCRHHVDLLAVSPMLICD